MARLIIISGPSGVGKDAIIDALVKMHPDWAVADSVTTRPKNRTDQSAKRYYYVKDAEFDQLIKEGKLLEWKEIHTWRYGMLLGPIAEAVKQGKMILLNINYEGGLHIKQNHPELHPLLIFIAYDQNIPIEEAVTNRFQHDPKRRALTKGELMVRIATAKEEMNAATGYDLVIENKEGEFEQTVAAVEKAIR